MFKEAGPFWSFILTSLGGHAITMPWSRAYILPEHNNRETRRHELQHLKQIRKDGRIRWTALYLWYLMTNGYWWHPYEVAARINAHEQAMEPHYTRHWLTARHLSGKY